MLSRLSQISRQLPRTRPTYTPLTASTPSVLSHTRSRVGQMTSSPQVGALRKIHTAGCIIIGDEILSGKTVDTNSAYLAKFCFALGIDLKRIEIIGDEEDEIVEAAQRFSKNYDFVVTSGGIGPTHDDITYQSIAKAFNLSLILYEEAFTRMKQLSKPHRSQPNFDWENPSAALEAKKRMVRLPIDQSKPSDAQVLFVNESLWVPIAVVNENIHILPGVPRLFEALLEGLRPSLVPRLTGDIHRVMISTPLAESSVASFLDQLAFRVKDKGVKIGSYPRWGSRNNTVTLVGRDKTLIESLVPEVEREVDGKRVTKEEEND